MTESLSSDVAKAERGTQHPAESLPTALELLEKLRAEVGLGSASRETVAEAFGYKTMSGHAARRLAVLSHFGLVEKSGRGAIKVSDLGKAILMPSDDAERSSAITQAAARPTLYAALIEKYREHALPGMLPNLLVREHGVFAGSAENAARTFRESMEFAGLLRNGILHDSPLPAGAGAKNPSAPPGVQSADDDNKANSPKNADRNRLGAEPSIQSYTIPLDQTGRVAHIDIPLPVGKRDLRKIGAWVRYMEENVFEDDDDKTPTISAN